MLKDIQRAIENTLNYFSVHLDVFSENETKFYYNNLRTTLDKNLDKTNLLDALDILDQSLELTLRAMDVEIINGSIDSNKLVEWIDSNSGSEIQVSINLDKKILLESLFVTTNNKNITMYINPNKFLQVLNSNNIENVIFKDSKPHTVFIPFWKINCITNSYLTLIGGLFSQSSNLLVIPTEEAAISKLIETRVKLLKLYCNTSGLIENITPHHVFYQLTGEEDDSWGLLNEINNLFVKLALTYICNISEEKYFLIRGYKEIKVQNHIENKNNIKREIVEILFNVYDSVYSTQTHDKLLILRNVMTIYLEEDCSIDDFLNNLGKISSAYESSTESYIKDKVKNFFDKKKDLEKYARDTSETMSKQISIVSDNMMKSWLAFVAALLGGAVTYIAKIDTAIIALFFLLYSLLSGMLLTFQAKLAKKEQLLLDRAFKHFLNNVDVINEERKKEVIGNIVEDKQKLLNSVINWFKGSIVVTITLSILLTVFFIFRAWA